MDLRNRSGQILIESVFVTLLMGMLLLLLSQLLDMEKSRTSYRFSKPQKETPHAATAK